MPDQSLQRGRLGWLLTAASAVAVIALLGLGVMRSDSPLPPLSGEKQEMEERQTRLRAEAQANPPPPGAEKPERRATPLAQPSPWSPVAQMAAGAGTIVETGQAPFPAMMFVGQNLWKEAKDGYYILAYAGSEGYEGDPSQGLLMVVAMTFDYKPLPELGGTYPTPSKAGAVRIVGADGEVLSLLAEDGTKFLFDVASRRFLSPDTLAPLPTPEPPPESTPGSTDSSISSPLSVASVAIDMDINNSPANTATSLGSLESCGTLNSGASLTIDVVIRGIPPGGGASGGLLSFQFSLLYDAAKVAVAWVDPRMLVAANVGSSIPSFGDQAPDSDGDLLVAALDTSQSAPESGDGVLARLTLQGVAAGISSLILADVLIVDAANNLYAIGAVHGAQVAVDSSCP